MTQDVQLLQAVYQNVQMGIDGIKNIYDDAKEDAFRQELRRQEDEYRVLSDEASEKLYSMDEKPEEIGAMAKAGTFISTEFNTMADSTTSHLAEMMIQGTSMGITKLMRKIRSLDQVDVRTQKLAQKVVTTEEINVENLKKYL
ncbi:MAG: hypothetical protein IJB86_10780 [Clostridia bacterium]|nr:hypothetical protein [Clostridia bacterium]